MPPTEATAYKPVPVAVALAIADHFDKDVVVIFAIDRACDKNHMTTYGKTAENKIQAAVIADLIGSALDLAGPHEKFEDFRTVDAAKRAEQIQELVAAGQELLDLIDAVPVDARMPDETDRVFPRYEFERLRAAVAAARPQS